jgi:hypothetical protein
MATPNLSLVPAISTTYNVGMAETFSWVPMQGLDRPLFARATYLANASDIAVSLSANNIDIYVDELEDLARETNTLLNALTAKSVDIDVNTDEVEDLIRESNTLLNNLTGVDYATSFKQDVTNTLLDTLTGIDYATGGKQDLTNTLLNNLTGVDYSTGVKQDLSNTLLVNLTSVDYATSFKQDVTNTLLAAITATSNRINGFVVPDYNKIKNFYYGNSTNISSVQYLQDTTVVAELSFTYVDPVSAEGARLDEVIKL